MFLTTSSRHYDQISTFLMIRKTPEDMEEPKETWAVRHATRPGLLLLGILSSFSTVQAGPLPSQEDEVFERRDTPSGSSPSVWIPIVVSAIVLVSLMVLVYARKAIARKIMANRSSTSATANATNAPRELTAEQLAGTINNGGATGAAPASRRARRPRRQRRTPSQISVTSLPEYMKEPGDEEVVIFRGRDAEDVTTMPAAVVMDAVDEERDDDNSHRSEGTHSEEYDAVPQPANHIPLLENENLTSTVDASNQGLRPPQRDLSRVSVDSGESSSLMRIDSNLPETSPDPLGPSPAYFEVVDEDSGPIQPISASTIPAESSPGLGSPSPPSSPEVPSQNRRSGFRTLLNRMSIHGTAHQRGPSGNSALSASTSNHRPNLSQSSSFFRTLSRQRSTHTLNSNHLNSPSMISLNSISSPLTHTAVRTEFTYPKTGPTPEQLMIIASRESIGRFGVPYGPDAVSFAASASMHELLPPPPDFDSAERGQPNRSVSRLRTSVDVSEGHIRNGSGDTTASSISGLPRVDSPITLDAPGLPSTQSPFPTAAPSSPLSPTYSSGAGATTRGHASEFGQRIPPSSFHDPTLHTIRSESVASMVSARTYATAAESLNTGTARSFAERYGVDEDEDEVHLENAEQSIPSVAPTEPATKHVLEPTDMTITPNTSGVTAVVGGNQA
ncbi:hypothetical protein CPB83DRAFT_850498 [Crepidotus variabilis]|uniref:Uncharacterized protein n=1 Tax=Crepidotus variabilis TaxID=179855 RepID=A0A9P6JR99_9AGAR|nr:hypothetical protein CPB83DRAFT_850498 [Crepidotus variabilis]